MKLNYILTDHVQQTRQHFKMSPLSKHIQKHIYGRDL